MITQIILGAALVAAPGNPTIPEQFAAETGTIAVACTMQARPITCYGMTQPAGRVVVGVYTDGRFHYETIVPEPMDWAVEPDADTGDVDQAMAELSELMGTAEPGYDFAHPDLAELCADDAEGGFTVDEEAEARVMLTMVGGMYADKDLPEGWIGTVIDYTNAHCR